MYTNYYRFKIIQQPLTCDTEQYVLLVPTQHDILRSISWFYFMLGLKNRRLLQTQEDEVK